jgi:hypothetical protein
MASADCPNWEALGFACQPEQARSSGTELVFRCYSSAPGRELVFAGKSVDKVGSHLFGNCFFVPRVSGKVAIENAINIDREKKWTAGYLEAQLNAFFWGNDFDRIAMFQLRPGVAYWIGPVGQDTLASSPYIDRLTGQYVAHQRHLAWPGVISELLQVVLAPRQRPLMSCINHLEDWKVLGSLKVWGHA